MLRVVAREALNGSVLIGPRSSVEKRNLSLYHISFRLPNKARRYEVSITILNLIEHSKGGGVEEVHVGY